MKQSIKWTKVIFIIGAIAIILGIIDPMEGSIVIATGSFFIAFSTFVSRDHYRKIFLVSAIMIIVGVLSMFYVSSLGGFDPKHAWWWDVLILPYPLGWLISVITLIVMAVKNLSAQSTKTS
jgi:hypothetical protein